MLSAVSYNKTIGIFTVSGVILGAIYMLSLYARVMFGKITNPEIEKFSDVTVAERLYYIPLAIITLVIGIYPKLVNSFITKSITGYAKLFFME